MMDGGFIRSPLDLALELADTYGWHVFPMKLTPKGDGKHKKIYLAKWSQRGDERSRSYRAAELARGDST